MKIEEIFKYIHYQKDINKFIWIKNTGYVSKIGKIAGFKRNDGYRIIKFKGRRYYEHRLIYLWYNPCWNILNLKEEIDHIDRNRSNNKIENLRIVNSSIQSRNITMHSNNTSGYTNICWDKNNNKWLVRVCQKYIGRYKNINDAISSMKKAQKEFGGFTESHGTQNPNQ